MMEGVIRGHVALGVGGGTRSGVDLCRWSAAACRVAAQELGDDHEIVRQHGGANQQFETLATFDERALHAAPSEQHGDAAFDARAESLPFLERRTLLER